MCPNCGYCRHCGRGGHCRPVVPWVAPRPYWMIPAVSSGVVGCNVGNALAQARHALGAR